MRRACPNPHVLAFGVIDIGRESAILARRSVVIHLSVVFRKGELGGAPVLCLPTPAVLIRWPFVVRKLLRFRVLRVAGGRRPQGGVTGSRENGVDREGRVIFIAGFLLGGMVKTVHVCLQSYELLHGKICARCGSVSVAVDEHAVVGSELVTGGEEVVCWLVVVVTAETTGHFLVPRVNLRESINAFNWFSVTGVHLCAASMQSDNKRSRSSWISRLRVNFL